MCAAWAEYWRLIGRGQLDGAQVPQDVHAASLTAAAMDDDPAAFIELPDVFGDLGHDERFRSAFVAIRATVADQGMGPALDRVLSR